MLGDLGDVEEAVGAGEDFDEGAELCEPDDFAEVRLADFRNSRDVRDHLDGAGETVGVGRGHIDAACVVDIDLDARCIDDATNDLAAGSDEVADLVGRDLDGVDARSELRLLFGALGDDGVHRVQKEEPAVTRLLECFAHDLGGDAHDLDVHLQGGDAVAGAGDLEVHVAVVVFGACDVGEDGVLVAFLDEAHRHTGNRTLERNAGLHEREGRAADGGHGGGAVRLEDVRDDAEGVGRLILGGEDGLDGAPGESAVADFATTYAGHTSNLTNGERREVIVQHELPLLLAFVAFHALRIVGGAERCADEGLGFAASEESRTVHAGEDTGLDGDLANLVEGAVIGANALVEHLLAEDALAEALEVLGELLGSRWIVGGERFLELVLNLLDLSVAVEFGVLLGVESVLEAVAVLRLQIVCVGFVVLKRGDGAFGLAREGDEVVDACDDLLDLFVGEFDGTDDNFFGDFLGARLDHHDAVFGADNHDVQLADQTLRVGWIHDVLAVNITNANRADRAMEGDVRECEGAARTVNAEDVGVIFLVGGVDECDDLGLVAEGLGEEGADGAVDLARGEDFLLAGAAFTLDEAAGDASASIGEFAVFDGEREEVDALFGVGRCDGGCQYGVVATGGESGAGSLLGDAPCLEFNMLATGKLNGYVLLHKHSSFSVCL